MPLAILFITFSVIYSTEAFCSGNTGNRICRELQEIDDGEPCINGKLYRQECNTCKCLHNKLFCTKMACLSPAQAEKLFMKSQNRNHYYNRLRSKNEVRNVSQIPDLPEGLCKPGRFYSKNCMYCYCNDNGDGICSNNTDDCERKATILDIKSPEDFGLRYTSEEKALLPSLPNEFAKCEPGMIYRVDCNTCLCTANNNLKCSSILCISFDDMNRIGARKLEGRHCNNNDTLDLNACMNCKCVDNKLSCNHISGCTSDKFYLRSIHGAVPLKKKANFEFNTNDTRPCVPHTVYKILCNKCYCQVNKKMRCTQKTCINYVSALNMKIEELLDEKNNKEL